MKAVIIVIGVLLVLGSIPVAAVLDLSVNGCCGAAPKGFPDNAIAAVPLVLMPIVGTVTTAYGIKHKTSH